MPRTSASTGTGRHARPGKGQAIRRLALALGLVASTGVVAGAAGSAQGDVTAPQAAADTRQRGDFNRDGYADLAVGIPGEDALGRADSGAVLVTYGGPSGLSWNSADTQALWPGDEHGTPGVAEAGSRFGSSLASGDFNGDGMGDLAVGAPGANGYAGAVYVVYGSPAKLNHGTRGRVFRQGDGGVADVAEAGDGFGRTLAAADVDGDGRTDLVVGSPNETVDDVEEAGTVQVLFGGARGLSGSGSQILQQGTGGVPNRPAASNLYGSALAACDFNGDGAADLAVDAPGQDVGEALVAGMVLVTYGGPGGLTGGTKQYGQGQRGVRDEAEAGDEFGHALAAGDFDGDGLCDLAVGTPREDVGTVRDAGVLQVLRGGPDGLTGTTPVFREGALGVSDSAEPQDFFGYAMTAADFDGDGRDDLAVSTLNEDRDVADSGVVHFLPGGPALLTGEHSVALRVGDGLAGTPSSRDRFGAAMAAGDFNRDGHADLAIAEPGHELQGQSGAGAVHVLYPKWLGSARQLRHQGSPEGFDTPSADDRYGAAIATSG